MPFVKLCFISCLSLALLACSNNADDRLSTITGSTMGTTYSIKIIDLPKQVALDTLKQDIETRLQHLNQSMSTYIKDSELSFFNLSAESSWQPASSDLIAVLSQALNISQLSDGAFDITVGPLVNLWGFGPNIPLTDAVPDDDDIQAMLKQTGYQKLEINSQAQQIRKTQATLYVDLSAIAKGYAVDQVADYLEQQAIEHYLVEIGGELRGHGLNAQNQTWRIAIEKPSTGQQNTVHRIITPKNHSIATSGDYRNYFEENGKRYSHTIDPRTGRPIEHTLASVTVIRPTAAEADGIATALMVLGPEAGFKLANEQNWPAFFIIKQTDGFTDKATDAFKSYLVQ